MARYFIIAGEASGDMHAARLIDALRERDVNATFAGLGGDRMQAAGCRLYRHYNQMAYMGYVAVIAHIGDIVRNMRIAKQAMLSEQPDELILVDYPGFNLRMAQFAKQHLPRTRVTYYIPPKVWAWKQWRVHQIGKYCDTILGIFPFEPQFYAQYGYACTYVGNPTVDAIVSYKQSLVSSRHKADSSKVDDTPYVALLPGSRRHEIKKCLPRMLAGAEAAIRTMPEAYRIVVTQAPGIESELYRELCDGHPLVTLTSDTYDAVRHAQAAVVNSGTATLETALLGCPQVAVYHLAFGHLLGWLRPILFQIPHFTLVNIIAKRELVKELLAYEFTADAVAAELSRLLNDDDYVWQMRNGYAEVRKILGSASAAQTAAELVYN